MKKKLLFLICLSVVLAWSCNGGDKPGETTLQKTFKVTPEKLQVEVGKSKQIKAEMVPADPQEMPFEWESNSEVITITSVTSSGEAVSIKGISEGMAEVTVRGHVNKQITRKIPVTVIDNTIPLTDIIVTPETLSLDVGKNAQLRAEAEPKNATGVSFSWESDDETIATVNQTGLSTATVSAVAKGTTSITVKSGDTEKKIPVTVTRTLRIEIGNTTYLVDTLDYQMINEGISFLKFSIPQFVNGFGSLGQGLVVHSMEVDLTYPEHKIEVWSAKMNGTDNREIPFNAFNRVKNEIDESARKPVALTNGDFYVLDQHIAPPEYGYLRRRPHGMEATNGMLIQTPFTDILGHTHVEALIIRDNGLPDYTPKVSFTGSVKAESGSFTLSEVNSFANEGELVLFNNMAYSYGPDSALAWSPYISTMVSLSYPEAGWQVNAPMKFKVTKIEHDVKTEIPPKAPYGGKRFNGEGAILVGNPTSPGLDNGSKKFLSSLNVGDEIEITTEVRVNGNKINDKKLNIIGVDVRGAMLKNGLEYNTWDEAHPRTAFGYTKDQKKAYIIVVDGRQAHYSVGATTGQVAAIMKALGAYTALNLDGGGSSAMIVNGVTVNKPSDNPQRPVANGVMVTTKK
ncbi:MAG: phosphodiester glycosidase family protein [Proteiniphilum sp.]